MLDYTLPQVRGFLAAIAAQDAAREARHLTLAALASRGSVRDLDKTLDRLNEAAQGAPTR